VGGEGREGREGGRKEGKKEGRGKKIIAIENREQFKKYSELGKEPNTTFRNVTFY
jgi:hypothetical protein